MFEFMLFFLKNLSIVLSSSRTLEKIIQSVINQTYPNIEYSRIDSWTNRRLNTIKKYELYIYYGFIGRSKERYFAENLEEML